MSTNPPLVLFTYSKKHPKANENLLTSTTNPNVPLATAQKGKAKSASSMNETTTSNKPAPRRKPPRGKQQQGKPPHSPITTTTNALAYLTVNDELDLERTPPWHRLREEREDADEEEENEEDEEDDEVLFENDESVRETRLKQLWRMFHRNAKEEDRLFLTQAFAARPRAIRLPGDWKLEKQTRFGSFCQTLGFKVYWEGGFLHVRDEKHRVTRRLAVVSSPQFLKKMEQEEEEEENKKSKRSEEEGGVEEEEEEEEDVGDLPLPPFIHDQLDEMDSTSTRPSSASAKRRESKARPRAWQSSSSDLSTRLSFSRRSSIGIINNINNNNAVTGRRSSVSRLSMAPLVVVSTTGIAQSNRLIASSPLILRTIASFLDLCSLTRGIATVSRAFHEVVKETLENRSLDATIRLVSYFSSLDHHSTSSNAAPLPSFAKSSLTPKTLLSRFTKGKALGEGAYKRVFKVKVASTSSSSSSSGQRGGHRRRVGLEGEEEEAISVMSYGDIANCGDVEAVKREVEVGLRLSRAVANGWCPNFVRTIQVFHANFDAPWDPSSNPLGGSSGSKADGVWQYIRMELCTHGDLESHMRGLKDEVIPLEESRSAIFQMVFALDAGKRIIGLRHFDVKCLNYFVTETEEEDDDGGMRYGLVEREGEGGSRVFFNLGRSTKYLIKLADYGTAETAPNDDDDGERETVDTRHFTTLENTPPEFLLIPNCPVGKTAGFSADVFALALAILHVLTGSAPYEEILSPVRAPKAFRDEIARVWKENEAAAFKTVRRVARGAGDEETLINALYRYCVLVGVEEQTWSESGVVLEAMRRACLGVSRANSNVDGKGGSKSTASMKRYDSDRAQFSLRIGQNYYVERARTRAKKLGIFEFLLRALDFDPKKRPTTENFLTKCPAFGKYRVDQTGAGEGVVFCVPPEAQQI